MSFARGCACLPVLQNASKNCRCHSQIHYAFLSATSRSSKCYADRIDHDARSIRAIVTTACGTVYHSRSLCVASGKTVERILLFVAVTLGTNSYLSSSHFELLREQQNNWRIHLSNHKATGVRRCYSTILINDERLCW